MTIKTSFCRRVASATALLGSLGLHAASGNAQTVELLPNLVARPAFDISVTRNTGGILELRFAASSWNSGTGPLELVAGEVVRRQQNVYQRIYSSDGLFRDQLVGAFVWHQLHNHFHLEDYALYKLQPVGTKSSRTSAKTSFCVMDTSAVDLTLPGAPQVATYANCGNSVQGMSVGWGDTYGAHLPGQSISLSKLKSGDYRLSVVADPKNHLSESDESDNTSCALLRISVSSETVTVLDPDSCAGT